MELFSWHSCFLAFVADQFVWPLSTGSVLLRLSIFLMEDIVPDDFTALYLFVAFFQSTVGHCHK